MNDTTSSANAFCQGWVIGNRTKLDYSPRMAIKALDAAGLDSSADSVTAFCNGSDDGKKDDKFRLDLQVKVILDEAEGNNPTDVVDLTIAMKESFGDVLVEFIINDVFTKDDGRWWVTPFKDAEAAFTGLDEDEEETYHRWCEATNTSARKVTDPLVLDRLNRMVVA